MSSLSQFIKNGQQFQARAGSAAINVGDLLVTGGPGLEIFTAATLDYAKTTSAIALLPPTSLAAYVNGGGARQQIARDSLGNIFVVTTNASGNLVVNKSAPLSASAATAILDATATSVNTAKLVQLSNGMFAVVYARAAGALYFVIFDSSLNFVAGPTSVASEYAATNVVYHDAIALNGGGFALAFQTPAGTAINLATYSNVGAAVLAAASIQTLASTNAQEFIRLGQLTNGNLVVAYRGAMTAGGTAGTGFTIVSTAGVNVAGPTNVDSVATLGFLELSVIFGGATFALAEANGTTIKAGVYSQAGALAGSLYSAADTLNSTTYPQVKLTNDGAQYWLAYFGSAAFGVNVVQIPLAGASLGLSLSGIGANIYGVNTWALDAEIINGLLVVLGASSSTLGQYWFTVGLPDASLGINAPYLRVGPTSNGLPAATTGSNWPRVISSGAGLYRGASAPPTQPVNPATNGDFAAIFVYDQQSPSATYLAVQKVEASAIVGAALSAVVAGLSGSLVTINAGPGQYVTNAVAGTQGVSFNHTTATPEGIAGVLYTFGGQFGSTILGASAASAGSSNFGGVAGNLQAAAGPYAININDLVEINSVGQLSTVTCSDNAAVANIGGTPIAKTTVTAYVPLATTSCDTPAGVGATLKEVFLNTTDGSIYCAAPYLASNYGLTLYKYTSAGALVGSVVLDSSANQPAHIYIVQLSNTTLGICWSPAGTAVKFAIIDLYLNPIVAATTVVASGVSSSAAAIALSGGGIAITYGTSSGTYLGIYSNTGSTVYSPTLIAGSPTTANTIITPAQLSNSNIVIASIAPSVANCVGYSIRSITGVSVLAYTVLDTATCGPIIYGPFISALPSGYFCIGISEATHYASAWVLSNAGTIQGAPFIASAFAGLTTLNLGQLGLSMVNDGTNFWFICSASSGPGAIIFMPITGTGYVATLTGNTGTINAIIDRGLLLLYTYAANLVITFTINQVTGRVVQIASTSPVIGSTPLSMFAAGDSSVLLGSIITTTSFSVVKYLNSAIVGVAQAAIAAGNAGTLISYSYGANLGLAGYSINPIIGSPGKGFNHSASNIVGNLGTMFPAAVSLGGIA